MTKLLLTALAGCAAACAQAPTCTSPNSISIYGQHIGVGGTATGSAQLAIHHTSSTGAFTVNESKGEIKITNGALSYCAAPGSKITVTYRILNPPPLSGVSTSVRYWTVPNAGGPYNVTTIEGDIAPGYPPYAAYSQIQAPTAVSVICLQVNPTTGVVIGPIVCTGASGSLFDSVPGLFDSAIGLFDTL